MCSVTTTKGQFQIMAPQSTRLAQTATFTTWRTTTAFS